VRTMFAAALLIVSAGRAAVVEHEAAFLSRKAGSSSSLGVELVADGDVARLCVSSRWPPLVSVSGRHRPSTAAEQHVRMPRRGEQRLGQCNSPFMVACANQLISGGKSCVPISWLPRKCAASNCRISRLDSIRRSCRTCSVLRYRIFASTPDRPVSKSWRACFFAGP